MSMTDKKIFIIEILLIVVAVIITIVTKFLDIDDSLWIKLLEIVILGIVVLLNGKTLLYEKKD